MVCPNAAEEQPQRDGAILQRILCGEHTPVQLLLDAGAIDEFSIGYYADKYRYEKREGYPYEVRVLEAITVIEVSPVTRAANPKAVLTDKKDEDINTNPNQTENMEDMKKQLETIEQKAAAAEKKG